MSAHNDERECTQYVTDRMQYFINGHTVPKHNACKI